MTSPHVCFGRLRGRWFGLALAFATVGIGGRAAEPPRLAVLLAIDQGRADYLERFRPYLVEGGFRRLLEGGAVYRETHYRHALTATAPGHATLATGVHAEVHGIMANEWFDVAQGRFVGSIEDAASPLVGVEGPAVRLPGGVLETTGTASPVHLRAETVGDQLKLRYGASAKVIGLANKDRGAIFLSGRLADAAYWFHGGGVVTSRYYRPSLPAWVTDFMASTPVRARFGQTWDRLLVPEVYDAVQGPDDAPGEEARLGLGTVFPRRIDGGLAEIGPAFFEATRLDPASSDWLEALAERAVVGEGLGADAVPDLLCVSFSQLDYCGHSFGPDSHEIMDSFLRLDRALARFFTFLDQTVGEGRWAVVVSADHGVSPLPERVAAFGRGLDAGRIDYPGLTRAVEAALTTAFGEPAEGAAWTVRDSYGYRLVPSVLVQRGVDAVAARAVIKAALLAWPQVAMAWTREELVADAPTAEAHRAAWRRAYYPPRSQDVVFSPKPHVVDRSPAGTNHGTPYRYDTHVPLVWYGAGVPPGVHGERVGTDALAPTLARLLGVDAPPRARAAPLF